MDKIEIRKPSPVLHLDEVYTKINGKMDYLWRAVTEYESYNPMT